MKTESDGVRGQEKAEVGEIVRRQRDRRKIIQCKGNNTTQARADEWKGNGIGNGSGPQDSGLGIQDSGLRSQDSVFGIRGRGIGKAKDKHAMGKGQKSAL